MWVGDWIDCNILIPSSSDFSSTSFSFCWLLSWGSWGPGPLWELVLTTASYLQLTEPVCGPGLYNCLTSTCFLWASHLHPIQPVHSQGYTQISSTGCTCYLHRCISYLTARPRINMSQVYPTTNTESQLSFEPQNVLSLSPPLKSNRILIYWEKIINVHLKSLTLVTVSLNGTRETSCIQKAIRNQLSSREI